MAGAVVEIPGAGAHGEGQEVHGHCYLDSPSGVGAWLKSWFLTLDHKRIGILYLFSVMSMFGLGGLFAVALRTELLSPEASFLTLFVGQAIKDAGPDAVAAATADWYNQMFTLHGAVMVFLVIIPGIPAALGNFVLPLQLGAKDVAFPRLNLASYWLYMTGAVFFVMVLLTGGLDTGWTLYTPYSLETSTSVILAVTGAFMLGFSSIFTGINFIATIHKMRPEGMGYFQMPLFLWSIYATAIIQVLATPVLGITLVMLIVERAFGFGIFNPELGGDPVLFQHMFWFYSHPAVYVMVLPSMGVISELVSCFSRKHIFGYKFIAFSSVAIALLGFVVWGHHMFVSTQEKIATYIFSLLTFSVAIPSGVKVFNWLATMYKGSISLETPMLYVLIYLFLFGIGGLTGLFLGAVAVNMHLHDTYFIIAHFHYVMLGTTLFGLFAGIHFWWPKITGRIYSEALGRWSALLLFVGFNLTFLPQFVAGSKGMPRRYATYAPEFQVYHVWSTVGAYVLSVGFLLMLWCFVKSLVDGKKSPKNPWGAATLEWQALSPPDLHNFIDKPYVREPYDFEGLKYDEATEGYYFDKEARG